MVGIRKNNKAQITLFVVIGIIVLFVIGLVLYLLLRTQKQQIPDEPILENIPTEFKPVRTYVEACIQQIAEQGIIEMASHGGYIDPQNRDYSYFDFEYDPTNPTESELISISNNADSLIIPYWYYLTGKNSCDECGPSTIMPTIEFMQAQLSLYIQDNIAECLGGFSGLVDTGFDINVLSDPIAETTIHNQGQNFLLNYELEATKEDNTQIITDYFTKSSLPLKKLYDIAYNITLYESTFNAIDSFTKYVISTQTGPSMDLLPPFFYQDDSKLKLFWNNIVIKEKIKQILFSYTQLLQVMGTRNFDDTFLDKIPDDLTMEKTLYLQGMLPLYSHNDFEMKNYSVTMNYLNQPIYVQVWPHDGIKIEPKEYPTDLSDKSIFLSESNSNYYRFFYDISYPLVVEIKNHDINNKNNEMTFFFALEINIRKNKLINEYLNGNGPIIWDPNNIQIKILNTDTTEAPVDYDYIPGNKASTNLFCNPEQRISGNISGFVYNKLTGQGIGDVIVSYGCGTYEECALGLTNSLYTSGYFSSKMPLCLNGYVSFEKIGYKTERVKLSTIKDQSENIGSIGLYPLVTKNVSVKKFSLSYDIDDNYRKINGVKISDTYSVLNEDETAILRMNLINDGINPKRIVFININSNNTKEIELVPGKYSIDIIYLDSNGKVIPKECDKKCYDTDLLDVLGLTEGECFLIPPDPIEIKPAPWGGLDFNESNPISLRPQDIYDTNKSLELYLITYPEPNDISCLNSLDELSKKTSYTLQYRSRLVPKFVDNVVD